MRGSFSHVVAAAVLAACVPSLIFASEIEKKVETEIRLEMPKTEIKVAVETAPVESKPVTEGVVEAPKVESKPVTEVVVENPAVEPTPTPPVVVETPKIVEKRNERCSRKRELAWREWRRLPRAERLARESRGEGPGTRRC